MDIEIRKRKGIDELVSGYSPGKVDESKNITAMGKDHILFNKYQQKLLNPHFPECLDRRKLPQIPRYRYDSYVFDYFDDIVDVLTPEQINRFLQMTVQCERYEQYAELTGSFVSRLLQNSYNAGHNNFTLDTRKICPIFGLGSFVYGTPERPLILNITGNLFEEGCTAIGDARVSISGDVLQGSINSPIGSKIHIKGEAGHEVARLSQDCTFDIECRVNHNFGRDCQKTIFTFHNDVGWHCGVSSTDCQYNFRGDVGFFCGNHAERSTFNFMGNIDKDKEFTSIEHLCEKMKIFPIQGKMKECTFRTTQQEDIGRLLTWAGPGNRIILANEEGGEEIKT